MGAIKNVVSIKNVEGFGYSGFSFSVKITDWMGDYEVVQCRTNECGNGLWVDGKQTEGTAQFSLSGKYSTDYQRIRRYFSSWAV